MVDEIGAANTLYRDSRLHWRAANTDYEGALAALRANLQEHGHSEADLRGKKVLILGAGGVARAIGLGLVRAGCGVTVSGRTHARTVSLAERLGCQQIQWENRGAVFADILVNCTPIGMFPEVDETPFPMNWFRDDMIVFDTVYNPENTLFLKQAQAAFLPHNFRHRNVRAAGRAAVRILHGPRRTDRRDARRPPPRHLRRPSAMTGGGRSSIA